MERVRDLAPKKAAVIFSKISCCMCPSIKAFFYELGASPAVHELDKGAGGRDMEGALQRLECNPTVPAMFIGGKSVGTAPDIISLHVDGDLKRMLTEAPAIWLHSSQKN
ncbi:Thioredoxin-disulfide reductase [Bertholletia excelsa]